MEASTTSLSDLPEGYAVVVANILAEELVRLAPQLTGKVAPGGWLILSGILTEKEDFVAAAFPELDLVEKPRDAEWSCLTMRKSR